MFYERCVLKTNTFPEAVSRKEDHREDESIRSAAIKHERQRYACPDNSLRVFSALKIKKEDVGQVCQRKPVEMHIVMKDQIRVAHEEKPGQDCPWGFDALIFGEKMCSQDS